MTTTCQQILERVRSMNPLNPTVTVDRTEILQRIRSEQQEVFTRTAEVQHDRFITTIGIASSDGTSERVVELSVLADAPVSKPVERILEVRLGSATGTLVNRPDVTDVEGEYPPRAIVVGETLVEVSNDWGTVAGVVTLWLRYVYGSVPIDVSGSYSQLVTVPDAWTDLLELPLARYLYQKDPGRDVEEDKRLAETLGDWDKETGRRGAYLAYLRNYGGAALTRFLIPTPRDRGPQ